jgi:hypothetical protein
MNDPNNFILMIVALPKIKTGFVFAVVAEET